MTNEPTDDRTTDPLDFENAVKRLEEIVHSLEEGELGLNQSLERYEEGVRLLRRSYELLQQAERKIELLSGVDAEGNPIVSPFDHAATFEQDETTNRRGRRRSASNAANRGGHDVNDESA